MAGVATNNVRISTKQAIRAINVLVSSLEILLNHPSLFAAVLPLLVLLESSS